MNNQYDVFKRKLLKTVIRKVSFLSKTICLITEFVIYAFFLFCFHFIWDWFWHLLNAVPPNAHPTNQQNVRLLFTLPWRIDASYFLLKIV